MSRLRIWWFVLLCVTTLVEPAAGQASGELVRRGIQAYRDLDLPTAVGLIRRGLAVQGEDSLAEPARLEALSYLAAAEFVRGRIDSAAAAFRRIVQLKPQYQLDPLVFPPDLAALYASVRRETKVVEVDVPPVARFATGTGYYAPRLFASSFHEIRASIEHTDGVPVRRVYEGLISDSLDLRWDGLDATGSPLESGRYFLAIESRLAGQVVRVLRLPLDIESLPADTVAHPPAPAASLFLPERLTGRPGLEALVGGLAGGVGIAVLPFVLAPDAGLSAGRVVVAGSVALAGVIGFLRQRPGRAIDANIRANEVLRSEWQSRLNEVVQLNAGRRSTPEIVVYAGPPTVIDVTR